MKQAVGAIRQSKAFDATFYVDSYAASDPIIKFVDPISHYLAIGETKGYRPSQSFDPQEYVKCHPELEASGLNSLLHCVLMNNHTSMKSATQASPIKAGTSDKSRKWLRSLSGLPDFSVLNPSLSASQEPKLDVIIPVYAGYFETLHTIYSVLKSQNQTSFELIVINDQSPDMRLTAALQQLSQRGLLTLLTNESNLGFVKTVNRALQIHEDRDAILLNSDTYVFGNWVDRLIWHFERDVATITPFSNRAALCSYPCIYKDNSLPSNITPAALDEMISKVNTRSASIVPTGVGFCMFVSRTAITVVGSFDANIFGKGYAEENDFCLRALKKGFRNLHAHDVFVYHKGRVSFGKQARVIEAGNLAHLRQKHPEFNKILREFALSDPALWARQRIDVALALKEVDDKKTIKFMGANEEPDSNKKKTGTHMVVTPELGGRTIRIGTSGGSGPQLPNLRAITFDGPESRLGEIVAFGGITDFNVHSLEGYAQHFLHDIKALCRFHNVSLKLI